MAKGRLTVIGMFGMLIGFVLFIAGMLAFFDPSGRGACGGAVIIALGVALVIGSYFARKQPKGALLVALAALLGSGTAGCGGEPAEELQRPVVPAEQLERAIEENASLRERIVELEAATAEDTAPSPEESAGGGYGELVEENTQLQAQVAHFETEMHSCRDDQEGEPGGGAQVPGRVGAVRGAVERDRG